MATLRAVLAKIRTDKVCQDPRAEYDKTNHIFKVYHSIGHQNYTPIVTSVAGAWGDVSQIVGVWSYSFDIKFTSLKKQASS
ncbi:hypothetical protein HMPREF1869_00833 [Bacteroidales bacterium KA00251]|nr:hypothetical protein HMPREF1869_00833 [Bacteroidales bacterium KA00251]